MRPNRLLATAAPPNTPDRRAAADPALIFLCCLPLLVCSLAKIFCSLPFVDFVGIWSAGRLFLAHLNPYSAAAILSIEQAHGWPHPQPQWMLYPPWTLWIAGLVALLPFRAAQIVWMMVLLALDAFSAAGLWSFFGGEMRSAWIAAAVFLTFTPFATVVYLGQVTAVMLAALTAVLLLFRSRRWLLAGMAAAGLGMKPQLLWLVFLALMLEALRERRLRFLAAAALTGAAFWAADVAFDPAAAHFLSGAYQPTTIVVSGIGGALRLLFGPERAWLQYLPCLAGIVWFAAYWARHRRAWRWEEHLPLLLLVSVATSPYCWFHDFVLALPAFIALAVRGAWRSTPVVLAWLAIQAIILLPEFLPTPRAHPLEPLLSALWIPFWIFASRRTGALPQTASARQPAGAV